MSSPSSKVNLASLGGLGGLWYGWNRRIKRFPFGNMGMILECL